MLNIFSGVGFSEIKLESEAPTITNESRNLKIQKWRSTAHRWRFEFTTTPLEPADYRRLFCNMVTAANKCQAFEFIHPVFSMSQGNPGNAATVAAPVAAGALQVGLKGLPANKKGVFVTGDPIRFSNFNKVYFVAGDVNSDANGQAVVTLNTNLQKEVTLNLKVIAGEVPFILTMEGDPLEIEIDNKNKKLLELSFEAVEDLVG